MEFKTAIDIHTDKLEDLTKIRKHLHMHPEVSGKEKKTADTVTGFLTRCAPTQIIRRLGGHGVAAIFDSGNPGKTVLIRAELDALPIQEINEFEHRSTKEGVSHKCGHDGHATILLGLAEELSQNKPTKGRVVLLFQPAEETGQGAAKVLADRKFKKIKPDMVFALHNLPAYPMHRVVYREKQFSSAVKSLIIKLEGKTSHAAEPENGINPAIPIARILIRASKRAKPDPMDPDFAIVTPIHSTFGEISYGVSAGYGELRLTLRCWNQKRLDKLDRNIRRIIREETKDTGINTTVEETEVFHANKIHPEALDYIRHAARTLDLELEEREFPFKWGEDFGYFTQEFPGAMFGLGSGVDQPALHNPDYDFPDRLIPTGIQMFYSIIQKVLE
ncbi:MAG: amidohydrolase [Bacteroidetes bacterium]|nr:amidohydrolase [Bacteroidota bacterium]